MSSNPDTPNVTVDKPWIDALFAAIDRQDTPAFLGFLTDDARFRFGSAPVVEGRANIKTAVGAFFDSIDHCRHRITQFWQQGASVICEGSVSYQRLDGSQLTLPFANIFELSEDRISAYRIYVDIAPLYAPPPD